jgi:hypothetical protein
MLVDNLIVEGFSGVLRTLVFKRITLSKEKHGISDSVKNKIKLWPVGLNFYIFG